MLNQRTTQTAFRFSPDMLIRMKNRARMSGQSLNRYVEDLIKKDLGSEEDKYEALYKRLSQYTLPKEISPEILALSKYKVEFTQEEIDADERLAYLLSK